jgi:hypothetical protein
LRAAKFPASVLRIFLGRVSLKESFIIKSFFLVNRDWVLVGLSGIFGIGA